MSDGRGCEGVDLLPCVEWREEDRDSAPVRTDSLRVAGRVSGRGHQLAVPRERLQEGSFSSVLHRLPANLTLAPGAKTSCRERCSWQQAFGKGDCMLSQEVPCAFIMSAVTRGENSDNVRGPVRKMSMQRHKYREAQARCYFPGAPRWCRGSRGSATVERLESLQDCLGGADVMSLHRRPS